MKVTVDLTGWADGLNGKEKEKFPIQMALYKVTRDCDWEMHIKSTSIDGSYLVYRPWKISVTSDYRKSLCEKLNVISDKVIDLPCKERRGIYESIARQLTFMWLVLGAVTLSMIASGMSIIFKR